MRLKQRLALAVARRIGWTVVPRENIPDKCVVIGYPHTSNWDFPLFLMAATAYGKRLNWLGKAELFAYGMGPLMRWLGGIGVRRDAAHGLVQEIVNSFERLAFIRLVIPPEGTRRRTEYWKSGFYRIALAANVPLHLGKVDYVRKSIDFGEPMLLTGDMRADMDAIRAWYSKDAHGLHPALEGRIRLRDEDEGQPPP